MLEISNQALNGDALDVIANQIFKENREITNVVLKGNQLGVGRNIRDKMTFFLEAFLIELRKP